MKTGYSQVRPDYGGAMKPKSEKSPRGSQGLSGLPLTWESIHKL